MADNKVDVCDVHLEKSILGKRTFEEFSRKEIASFQQKMKGKSAGEIQDMSIMMKLAVKDQLEDGISRQFREISDTIKVTELEQKVLTDKVTGKPIEKYSEAVTNRLRMLVGRNSVDTKARNLRNHFRNMSYHFEAMFRCNENVNFPKSISDIKKGSPHEKEVFTIARSYEHEIDPTTLTPEKVNSMLKTATEPQRLALAIVTNNTYRRHRLADFGITTKYSKEYVAHRKYDWTAVKEMGPEGFANYMYEHLDVEKTFGGPVSKEAATLRLRDVYDSMRKQSNEKLDPTISKDFGMKKGGSFETKFIWKNNDSAYETFNKFSVGALKDQIENEANALANRAIAISEFGYHPEKNLAELSSRLLNKLGGEPNMVDQWKLNQIKRAEKELSGQMHVVQGSLTNLHNNVRFFQAFTKLGNAVTGTVLDAVDNGRQSFYMNGSFFGGVADYTSEFVKSLGGRSKEEMTEIANNVNLIFTHLSNTEGMRLASGDLATRGGWLTNFIQNHGDTLMKYSTFLPQQTAYSNIASGLTGGRQFAKLVKTAKEGKLNKFQLDFVKEYGFTDAEIKALGAGFFEDTPNWSDTAIFTGTGIRNALTSKDPKAVAQALGVDPMKAGEAVLGLATKVESVINDWASRGTPKPELATKTLMGKNIESEGARVAIGFATQFLDTPIAQGLYVAELAQKLTRINDGNYASSIRDSAIPSAAYLTTGVSLYMAADSLMAVLTNRPSLIQRYNNGDDSDKRSIMLNAVGRTGYVPFLFEMIETQTSGDYNKTALDTFGSPALSTLRDTLRVAQGLDGKGGITGSEFLRRQLPTNSIPLRAMNNWAGQAMGSKIWDDKQGTFFGGVE